MEAQLYLLEQVANHQKALSSEHLLLHSHGALEQLQQEGQESGTVKTWRHHISCRDKTHRFTHSSGGRVKETGGEKRQEKTKNKVIFRGGQQSAGESSSIFSSLLVFRRQSWLVCFLLASVWVVQLCVYVCELRWEVQAAVHYSL